MGGGMNAHPRIVALLASVLATGCASAMSEPTTAASDGREATFVEAFDTMTARSVKNAAPEPQWAVIEAMRALDFASLVTVAFPALERTCRDGRGQDVAPLLVEYLHLVERAWPGARDGAAAQLVQTCRVREWEARSERIGFVELGPDDYTLAKEERLIGALLDPRGALPAPKHEAAETPTALASQGGD
jgi:hypothetical protein